MSDNLPSNSEITRRDFLRTGTLLLAASNLMESKAARAADDAPLLRVGLVTDLHYADKETAGTRHYRETLDKLAEAGEQFEKDKTDFIVELGDLIDAADSVETEQRWLKRINREFSGIAKDRHYVLGNHCVDTLKKTEFLEGVEQKTSYYSFDRAGWHFILLDSCYRADGEPYGRGNSSWDDANIPEAELEWLRDDLKQANGRTIVFAHQRLDGTDRHCVKNAAAIRTVLEESRRVVAVFQGHSHQNDYKSIVGMHYCTLAAMVEGSGAESNGYSRLDVFADGRLLVKGFRRQKGYEWM